MLKAKKYDWKDSNMALFGSDTEKQVKKESAESEPAWQGSGSEVGVQVWRIVKFKVEKWPKEDYGKFYSGDSYIILNTFKEEDSDELQYDVHFWIGRHSTQDEYGTAAYKTVELDTFHDDKPVQHREVQGHETALFKSYFDTIMIMEGGADTGFRRVTPEAYKPRLLRFKKTGPRNIRMEQIPLNKSNLTGDDVYILDAGLKLYQFNGANCSHDEKFKAGQTMQTINSERGGRAEKVVLDEDSTSPNHEFYDYLCDEDGDGEPDVERDSTPILKRVSDNDGSLDIEDVKEGEDITRDDLNSDDVYLVDVNSGLYVWIGNNASVDERKNALSYAHNYLQKTEYPFMPVTVIAEGRETRSKDFLAAVAGCA